MKNNIRKNIPVVNLFKAIILLILFIIPLSVSAQDKKQTHSNPLFTFEFVNTPIKQVFDYIQSKSDYVFLYYGGVVSSTQKATVKVKKQNIETVLQQLFKNMPVSYSIKDRQIILKRREQTLQEKNTKTITGNVVDDKNGPIIGATVLIKGTVNGVLTDINGHYSIQASEGDVLEYRFVGYKSAEKTVQKNDVINITLAESNINLDDVVVIGYGQQKKESVVSSVNSVKPSDIAIPARSLTNAIAGQVAGIIAIQRSGEPGFDDAQFWIRGQSSYAGGINPLVLVDGVPRNMSDIDVDEIESFTVLKDAAATAVYGAEGANGVVLITSKRGRTQKTQVNFNAQYSIISPTRMPKLMNSWDYLSMWNEAEWNEDGNPEWNTYDRPYSDEILDKYYSGIDPDLYPNAIWTDLLSKHTYNQRYTINFRGGSEKAKFFVSGAYYNESGIFKSNPIENYDANIGVTRYNLRTNVDMDLSPTTLLSIDLSGQYKTSNYPGSSTDAIFKHIIRVPTHLIPMQWSDGTASVVSDDGDGQYNPYNMLNHTGYTKLWSAALQSKVTLQQKLDFITKGLSAKVGISFDADYSSQMKRTKSPDKYYQNGRDPQTGELIKILKQQGSPLSDPIYGNSSGTKRIYIEAQVDYKRLFGEIHDISGTLVFNQKETQYQNVAGLSLLPYRKQNVVLRTSYAYDNRYILEGSFGATGSENFAKGHRWGIFPAAGLGWNINNETFIKESENLRFINKLRLRASYGLTGNDQIYGDRFAYREKLASSSSPNLGLKPGNDGGSTTNWGGWIEDVFAAPALTWEIEKKLNTGIDLGLFDGRIDVTFDWFKNRREQILITRATIPSASGFRKNPYQNFGITENQGVDASLILRHTIGDWNLSARGNLTYAHNKVIEKDEIPQIYPWLAATGQAINQPKVYIAEGLFTPDDFDITTNPDGTHSYKLKEGVATFDPGVKPGDIKYKDLNNDHVIDAMDQTYENGLYPNDPQLVYGFGINVEYKGIFAAVFFQGAAKTSVNLASNLDYFIPFQNGRDMSSARLEALNHWSANDPYNQNVLYPRLHSFKYANNNQASTWWYRDASFLRLKNVEVGYQFDRKLLQHIKMQNLRLYIQGTNLAVWDHVKLWDPELGNSGAKYPISSTWTMGLEVTF